MGIPLPFFVISCGCILQIAEAADIMASSSEGTVAKLKAKNKVLKKTVAKQNRVIRSVMRISKTVCVKLEKMRAKEALLAQAPNPKKARQA